MTTTTRRARTIDLAAYGERLDAFVAEANAERYRGLSGETEVVAVAPIHQRYGDLSDRAAISGLARLAGGSGEEARQAGALRSWALEGYAQRAVAELSDQIAAAEAAAVIEWKGERIAYGAVRARIAEISDRAERNVLDGSYREAVEAINPLRMARLARLRDVATELGFDDLVALADAINGFSAAEVAARMQRFLAASETVYFAALRRYLAEIDIEAGDGSAADLAYLLRGSAWDAWFESRRLSAVAGETLGVLGFDLAAQPNVTLDWEHRPGKQARAACVPVRVPGDVRLVMQPRGGPRDYAAALHELGHAAHLASIPADLPAADRHAGDASVREGYAFLLEFLASEPAWLAEHLRMPDHEVAAYVDFAAFAKLYRMRRTAARLLYELRLLRDPDPAIGRATYGGMLSLLTGVDSGEASWLADVDDNLHAARYLRAWMLEATLGAALRAAHGATWWTEPAAGEQLRGLWAQGQRPRGEDVLAQLGYDQFDWRPILHHVRTHLIGELSGYGGPNITTRAGTRKV